MKKLKVPNLVTIAVLTTITIVFWIFFSVFRIFTTKAPPIVPETLLTPLNPTLDKNVIDKMPQKIYIEENDMGAEITPTASPSATNQP